LFAAALRDGYILCQFMNKLRPQSIEKIEPREDGIFLSSNMTKFFNSCNANGFPPEDLFERDDLIRAKTYSLARVANTILALVKWAEMPAQTPSPDLLYEEESTMPIHIRCEEGNAMPIRIPPRRRIHVFNPHSKSNKSHVQLTWDQPNTRSMRNQSSPYSMTNQSSTRWRTKHSFTPRNATASSKRSSLAVSEANFGNQCCSADKAKTGLNPCVSRVEGVAGSPVMSTECTSTSDGIKSWKLFFLWEEGKTPLQFQLRKCIGRGPRASVYRAINWNTNQVLAVKRIQLEGSTEDEIVQHMLEVELVKQLSHPNIIKYSGVVRDNNTLNIALDYVQKGSLKQMLETFGKMSEKLVASYVIQVLEGLDYLHHNDIVHGNLKAANILITLSDKVKLSDIGISLNLRALEHVRKGVSRMPNWDVAASLIPHTFEDADKGIPCTPNWSAPEVINLKSTYTKSDIWSLGCTVIELLTGNPPYGNIVDAMIVMRSIVMDDLPPIPEDLSVSLAAFLRKCFHKTPEWRPSAKELSQHEWLNRSLSKVRGPRPEIGNLLPQVVNSDQRKNDAVRHLPADSDLQVVGTTIPGFASSLSMQRQTIPGFLQAGLFPNICDHAFVGVTFSHNKPVICRVCLESVEKEAVLCSRCCTVVHSMCAARAPH